MKHFNDLTLIISDFESGGTQKIISCLISIFKDKKITLIVLGKTRDMRTYKNVSLIKLNLQKQTNGIFDAIKNNIKIIFKIRNNIKKISSKNIISFIYETNILTVISCINLKKNIIVSERNNPYHQKNKMIWNLLRLMVYPLANFIVVNSFFAYDYFKRFVNTKKLKYIENPINIKKKISVKKNKIFIASSLTKKKSLDTIIKAFALFLKKNKDWRLIIAGKGPEENYLKMLANKLEISSNIDWLGFKKNLIPFYSTSKIFCLPSIFEGMSNSLLEALSFNLKCIVSDSIIHKEDPLKDFVTTFKQNDHIDLYKKLIEIKISNTKKESKFLDYAFNQLNFRIIRKKWEDLCI